MNPEYGRISELKKSKLKAIALLYAEVFGGEPWNEVWRCSSCGGFFGLNLTQKMPSPCCSQPLVAAYPEKETIEYINDELTKPFAQKRLFYAEGQLVGFAWGYQIPNTAYLAKEKWSRSRQTQEKIINAIGQYIDVNSPLYYISEVGVSPLFRRNGIGLQLTRSLLEQGLSLVGPVIFRTNWASPMMLIADRLEMTQIMGPIVEVNNGQILKTGEVAGFIDESYPERTLFIKLP
jgi:hypothetical protein